MSVSRTSIESVIRYPYFDGTGRILPDGVQLVLRSKNRWPLPADSDEFFLSTSWICQLAGWSELAPGVVAAKVMLLVDYEATMADIGVSCARMARLVFDDLKSQDFDENHFVHGWMESEHGWTSETNPYDWIGFFVDDEPGMNSSARHWTTPNLLHVQVRQIGLDDSFGTEQIVAVWNLLETRDSWKQVNIDHVNFDSFAKRLLSQGKQFASEIKHLDSLTSFRSWPYTFGY